MKTSIACLMLLAFVPSAGAVSVESHERAKLERALDQYAQALEEPDRDERLAIFASAEYGFASVIENGVENADLYTNLGNAALQAEHLGQAVLAYQRALRLDSEARAARQNLIHVRTLLPSWVSRPTPLADSRSLFFYRRLSIEDRSFAAALCFALAGASLVISVRRRDGAWRGVALMAGVAWTLIMASIVFDSTDKNSNLAVVTAEEVLARSADSRLAALVYPDPLPGGVEVDILEERTEWTRVRLHNGRDVWLRGSSLTRVED